MKQHGRIDLTDVSAFLDLTGGALRLFILLCRDAELPRQWEKSDYSSVNKVHAKMSSRLEWSEELKLTLPSLANMLSELVRSNMIRKVDTRLYIINPSIIFKGTSTHQAEAIKQFDGKI